ncbi:flagellar protein [Mobilitalea sibirica]|uniref:Flagellar protein n=1 Tax=Mobilitalea sibirica TaxID=1462919 RepID=A0A8J7KU25_9FIRM|nr:TIGR02530 family flagellar biosynthesis protein [Mobilitalea sibirica]MBH1941991.1 flagellar protein [Mobilitalea sibirica]
MNIPVNQFPSIEQMTDRLNPGKINKSAVKQLSGIPFSEILKEKQAAGESGELKFSKHANERLASRNIDLTDDQFKRLEIGTKKAGEKGINESLVMVDDLAFIVNIKNNTVITAVNDGEDKVFTNIDGAVIM